MANGINSVTISGKINWQPQEKKTDKYVMVTFPLNFYIGKVKDSYKYGNINCTCFDKNICETIMNIGKDGKIIVHGKLNPSEYEKDGKKVTVMNLLVDFVGIGE